MKWLISSCLCILSASGDGVAAFTSSAFSTNKYVVLKSVLSLSDSEELTNQKAALLDILRVKPFEDDVLADPLTKDGLQIKLTGAILADVSNSGITKYKLQSTTATYGGSSDSYVNLLEPIKGNNDDETTKQFVNEVASTLFRTFTPFVPPPVRSIMSNVGFSLSSDYVPMRDLFTSPAVSYAYERGWRQGFERAGFPGPDREAALAMSYFEPSMKRYNATRVLVDMSCATGLFTRRFAKSGKYKRVLGCDYSASMLEQARRFIDSDKYLQMKLTDSKTQLDLVRMDVGQIAMKNHSVDSLHAGAAMHCWPDLPAAVSEIYRVLKPGGRYFATTFLSSYFSFLSRTSGTSASGPSLQAFQYFESTDQLRALFTDGGFKDENISIEVLGNACVVIRCEK